MAKKKQAEVEAAPPAEEIIDRFNQETCRYLANEVNRIHGSGSQCSVAFNEVTLVPLAGVVASGVELEGYFTIPSRDRWDGIYTPEEIKEVLA